MPEHTPAPTPARSLYGFFMYLFSNTALAIYCIWAFTPDYYLHQLNIYYYPQKYWARTIPMQCLVALTIFAFIIYPSSNMILTANIDDPKTIIDSFSLGKSKKQINKNCLKVSCICEDVNKCSMAAYSLLPECEESTVPQLYDLDVREVCKKLYYNKGIIM